jgi:Domain of Unknown Function (DUF1080)
MKRMGSLVIIAAGLAIGAEIVSPATAGGPPKGFVTLFNGKDFTGWKVPSGDNGHWKIIDGVIDYDAKSEAKKKDLWTDKAYKDFVLLVDWRFKAGEKGYMNKVPFILPDGTHKKDENGKEIKLDIEDFDSGVYVRGQDKAQVNIWMWPIGSGEVYGYRMDKKMPPEVWAGVTPKKKMDRPRGEWNTFEITMKGDRLGVKLNGEAVIENAQLPGVAKEGPIGLQHHGGWNAAKGIWTGPPSVVQFRNIYIRELPD